MFCLFLQQKNGFVCFDNKKNEKCCVLFSQFRQRQEVGDRAELPQNHQRAAHFRLTGKHRQCGGVEEAAADLQGKARLIY